MQLLGICMSIILVAQFCVAFPTEQRTDRNPRPSVIVARRQAQNSDSTWRIQRSYAYTPQTFPRPPPFYNYNPYIQGYYQKPTSTESPSGPSPKFGGTGISSATGQECAPGIPKCIPRIGKRSFEVLDNLLNENFDFL